MTVKEIRDAVLATRSNGPLKFYLADGHGVAVPHLDYVFFPPVGTNIVVWTRQGLMRLIEASLITEIEIAPPTSKSRSGKSSRIPPISHAITVASIAESTALRRGAS
jgi:hypothetical protein